MPHDARDVANEIIRRGAENHQVFTHLQIQKLVYYCHAWMMGIQGQPLINQEVCAWEYGPVINDLYQSLKKYGRDQVKVIPRIRRETYSSAETGLIDSIIAQYGGLSGTHLSSLTHSEGSPWHQTVQKKKGKNVVIPNKLIQLHYEEDYRRFLEESTGSVVA